jgi:hypothetical protein
MIQDNDIEVFRILIRFDNRIISRLVEYCDRKIMTGEVVCDVVFDLSLCKNKECEAIDDLCRASIGLIENEMPSNVALSFLSRVYRESRFDLSAITDFTYKIYAHIPVMNDKKRMSFLNIGQSVYDLEYSGSESGIRQWLDREFEEYEKYENEIPL